MSWMIKAHKSDIAACSHNFRYVSTSRPTFGKEEIKVLMRFYVCNDCNVAGYISKIYGKKPYSCDVPDEHFKNMTCEDIQNFKKVKDIIE